MPRVVRRPTVLLLVCLVLGGLLLAVPGASSAARGAERNHWHGPMSLRPSGHGTPTGLSCGTPATCRLVDDAGATSTWQGQVWTRPRDIRGSWGELSAISCPTAQFCAAVGNRVTAVRTRDGWHSYRQAAYLDQVSCASAHFCLASEDRGPYLRWTGSRWRVLADAQKHVPDVGQIHYSCAGADTCLGVDDQGRVVGLVGREWRYEGRLSNPAGFPAELENVSVSCSSPKVCVAATDVESYSGPSPADILWRFHSGRWTTHVVDVQGPDEITHQPTASCSSRTSCVVVDSSGVAVSYDGQWEQPVALQAYDSSLSQELWQVGCAAADHCLVVDQERDTFVLDSQGWSTAHPYYAPVRPHLQVSCVSAHFCMALDGPGHARRWNGSRWVTARTLAPGGNPVITAISCTSPTFCRALDADDQAMGWNGKRWSRPTSLPAGSWDLMSCSSRSLCVAADSQDPDGNVLAWDGTTWSPAPALPFQVTALSCPIGAPCVAGGYDLETSTFDGTTWSAPVSAEPGDSGDYLHLLSCPVGGFCMAQVEANLGPDDRSGTMFEFQGVWQGSFDVVAFNLISCSAGTTYCVGSTFDGTRFKSFLHGEAVSGTYRIGPEGYGSASPVGYDEPQTTGLSCGRQGFCVSVDQKGNAFVRRP